MKLYHGTALRHLEGIKQQGLIPRGEGPGNWPEFPSRNDLVYLTTAYAPHFAKCAAEVKEPWVIVEIESDNLPEPLLPDEDFLEQATRNDENLKGLSLALRTEFFRNNIRDYVHHAQDSIDALGTCATTRVPLAAIERFTVFDPNANTGVAYFMIDPTISVLNYRIKGPFYRLLTKWFFDPLTEDEIVELCLPVPSSLLSPDDKVAMVKQLQDMEPPYGDHLAKMQGLLTDRSALAVYSPAVMHEIEIPR